MHALRPLLISLLLAALPPAFGAEPASAAAPEAASITFLDSTLFDNMLSRELNKGSGEVEVAVSGKMSLNSIPARVDKWITAVAEQGEVTLKPVDNSLKPKFVLSLLPVVYSFIRESHSERQVSVANKYNATVIYHVDKSSGESVIDKIVFTKKPR